MPSCCPSYSSENLPHGVICGSHCTGVTFDIDHVNTRMQDGDCVFTWKVTRTKVDEHGTHTQDFSGVETVACAGQKDLIFYCDDNQNCPRFRLRLSCVEQDGGGNG